MTRDTDEKLKNLRDIFGLPQPEKSEPTPFEQSVAAALTEALASLRAEGTIEVEDANMEGLAAEVIDAAVQSSSVKRLPLRIVKALIHSDLVEEVYGTDDEISAALHPFLDRI